MKRFFASIFAVYFFVLSVMPCSHALESQNERTQDTEMKASFHIDHTEHCSPFCTCNCCACPVVYQDIILHFDHYKSINKPYMPLKQGEAITTFTSFWQPPKID